MRVAFLGHFAPIIRSSERASSVAGNQVQRQIFENICQINSGGKNMCYAMEPKPAWPDGPIIVKSEYEESISFIGYVNIPILKHVIFAIRLLVLLIINRYDFCLQYNSYVFENLALIISRNSGLVKRIAIIVQDIHVVSDVGFLSKCQLRSCIEYASLVLARRFNTIVPINKAIIDDFHLPRNRCLVFKGGATRFALEIIEMAPVFLEDYGVFAGALEPYNGVNRLIEKWIADKIQYPLHIFGRGSLTQYVEQKSKENSSIIYHGFQPEKTIMEWQKRAMWNFCLRYSIGINESYFFPSKFFNIVCSEGVPMVNNFDGLDGCICNYVGILRDDLTDLSSKLEACRSLADRNSVSKRREIIISQYSWNNCVKKILLRNSDSKYSSE
jgi:glycosyltransferase involved in cell wall biosynthesis